MVGMEKKKKLSNTECVLIYTTDLSGTLLILRRTEPDVIKMHIGFHVK